MRKMAPNRKQNRQDLPMKSMMSVAPGGPETLTLVESETPQPRPGEVRIAVKAAGVNFPDTLIIRDLYQFKPERPFAPGGEVAGVVDAIGDGVKNVKPGDRVLAGGINGGFSTHFIARAEQVNKIRDAMPFEEAAAFMLTYGTSHYALKDRAKIKPGESLFILGAAGGVGAAAIELGKAMGAKVVAGVSSEDKAAFCKELGADEALVYPKGALDRDAQKTLSNEIKRLCGGEGADVIYDAVGGDYAEPSVRALAWEGRYLVVGFPAGIPRIPLNLTLLKGCQIMGVFWGAFTMRDPKRNAEHVAELFKWYTEGKIRPQVTATFPLEKAGDALKMIEERKAKGKVVLTVG
ncbi:MAG TPA: NADPH:quinone oxidoreductase family protein [Amphiplicatus sp.]|nr:NADPH:quinone oxidoreductase family protein [Amphiplicatus sp.]